MPEKPGKRVPAIFFRTEGGGEPVRDWPKLTVSAEDRLHGFIKKTRRTPAQDLNSARGNKKKHERGLL